MYSFDARPKQTQSSAPQTCSSHFLTYVSWGAGLLHAACYSHFLFLCLLNNTWWMGALAEWVIRWMGSLANESLGEWVIEWMRALVNESLGEWVIQWMSALVNESLGEWVIEWMRALVNESMSEWVNKWIRALVNESLGEWVIEWMGHWWMGH